MCWILLTYLLYKVTLNESILVSPFKTTWIDGLRTLWAYKYSILALDKICFNAELCCENSAIENIELKNHIIIFRIGSNNFRLIYFTEKSNRVKLIPIYPYVECCYEKFVGFDVIGKDKFNAWNLQRWWEFVLPHHHHMFEESSRENISCHTILIVCWYLVLTTSTLTRLTLGLDWKLTFTS